MIDLKPARGLEGVLVKLWRGGDYELTVTGRTEITPNFLRLHFTAPALLAERSIHPTMWVRLVPRRAALASAWLHPCQPGSRKRDRRHRFRHARRHRHPLGAQRRAR